MDKILEVAKDYKENLDGHKFHLVAGKNKRLLDLQIIFGKEHFKHLIGIHKLTDLPYARMDSDMLLHRILNGEIGYSDFAKSEHFYKMAKRIENFDKIKDTLFSSKLMVKSNHRNFRMIEADVMLSKKDETNANLHLFLKKDNLNRIVVPVTFIKQKNDYYFNMKDTARWTVIYVEEITSPKTDNSQLKNVLRLDGVDKTTTVTPTLPTNNTTSTTANSIVSVNAKKPKINKGNTKAGKKGGWGGGSGL